jgi:hypothetical protein
LANTHARAGGRLPAPMATATWHRKETLEEGIEGREILVRFDQRCT